MLAKLKVSLPSGHTVRTSQLTGLIHRTERYRRPEGLGMRIRCGAAEQGDHSEEHRVLEL